MVRTATIGLIAALTVAAVAFGGTEASYFALSQVVLLALSILLLLFYRPSRGAELKLPVLIPLLLVCLILLQTVPLPVSVIHFLGGKSTAAIAGSFVPISFAPYETIFNLMILITYLAAFYLTVVVCQRHANSKPLIFALLALGAFEAGYGLFQYFTEWGQASTYAKGDSFLGASGTYVNRNHFAGLLEMIFPFALVLAYGQFQKIREDQPEFGGRIRDFFKHEDFHKLILWLSLAILLFVALVFSQSRMGIISVVASTLVLFTLVLTSGWQRTNALLVVALFLVVALGAVNWIGPEPVIGRFQTLGQEYGHMGPNRLSFWMDTTRLIRDHPVLGSGLGTFSVDYPIEQTSYERAFVGHAHNDYLEFASEMGLPCALLFFGAIFYLLLRGIRYVRNSEPGFGRMLFLGSFGGLIAILIHSLADFNLHIPANGLLFAVLLGMVYASIAPHGIRSNLKMS
jgi:O-antigen ligase